jgi:pantoate--beta-alanine ligase
MEIIKDPWEMQAQARAWRQAGKFIALVPTMGYFHAGHVSLMSYGRWLADRLVVSLFVNPAQFGPAEDLDRYPRNLKRDAELAHKAGVDVLFTPEPAAMYPPGYQTYVEPGELSAGLCGASRPGHFRGVATVVLKLFNLVSPDWAVFGEKDYQQLRVIQQMAADLNLPLEVVGRPIVREPDGLAMSSRNTYLQGEERQAALSLSRGLTAARDLAARGEAGAEALLAAASADITASPLVRLDYLALVDRETLQPLTHVSGAARLAVAAWVGKTRLIDNILIEVH